MSELEIVEEVIEEVEVQAEGNVSAFLKTLVGPKELVDYAIEWVSDRLKGDYDPDEDDLNYFDYALHEHLRDVYLDFSREILSGIEKGSKRKAVKYYLEKIGESEDTLTWFEIYQIVSVENKDRRFAKFHRGEE